MAQDVRYALRLLVRAPAASALIILTLALGIGANTAIFSVLNAVLLPPLPYPDPERLVMIGERGADGSAGNVGYTARFSTGAIAATRSSENGAHPHRGSPTLIANGEPERISGMRVSANFFRMLGVTAGARPRLRRGRRHARAAGAW